MEGKIQNLHATVSNSLCRLDLLVGAFNKHWSQTGGLEFDGLGVPIVGCLFVCFTFVVCCLNLFLIAARVEILE